jgi:hypothetical protein
MAFNKALPLFTKGMAALLKSDLSAASVAFNSSKTLLWRNTKQIDNYTILNEDYQYAINTASLELRGDIASQQGNYEEALIQKKIPLKQKNVHFCLLLLKNMYINGFMVIFKM